MKTKQLFNCIIPIPMGVDITRLTKVLENYDLSVWPAGTASELDLSDDKPQGIIITTELDASGNYHTEYCDLEYYYKTAPYDTYKRMTIDEWCDQMDSPKELIW